MANAEEFARDVLVELLRGALEELRLRVGDGVGINHGDLLTQVKVTMPSFVTFGCHSLYLYRSFLKFTV